MVYNGCGTRKCHWDKATTRVGNREVPIIVCWCSSEDILTGHNHETEVRKLSIRNKFFSETFPWGRTLWLNCVFKTHVCKTERGLRIRLIKIFNSFRPFWVMEERHKCKRKKHSWSDRGSFTIGHGRLEVIYTFANKNWTKLVVYVEGQSVWPKYAQRTTKISWFCCNLLLKLYIMHIFQLQWF